MAIESIGVVTSCATTKPLTSSVRSLVLVSYVATFRLKTGSIEQEVVEKVKSSIQLNKYHNVLLYQRAFQLDLSQHFDLEAILKVMVQKDKVTDAEQLVSSYPGLFKNFIDCLCENKYVSVAADFVKKHRLDIQEYPYVLTNQRRKHLYYLFKKLSFSEQEERVYGH